MFSHFNSVPLLAAFNFTEVVQAVARRVLLDINCRSQINTLTLVTKH